MRMHFYINTSFTSSTECECTLDQQWGLLKIKMIGTLKENAFSLRCSLVSILSIALQTIPPTLLATWTCSNSSFHGYGVCIDRYVTAIIALSEQSN